ncbi:MAG: signal peptidase II [Dysgonamonadaceae bacterium]|jgi:lipoprotein signal peptidase|nr:signal peptidase II [Dysgonamonadaceae bacterium]
MKIQTIILWVVLLIIIDQVIKIIIYWYYFDIHVEIVPSLLEFNPIFNDKHSYVSSLISKKFHVNIGLLPHLITFFILQVITFLLYGFFKKLYENTKLIDCVIIFQLAGMICALIGNIVWEKGTLDYIYLKPLFTFDLKDLYINTFACLFFIFWYKHRKELKSIKWKDVIKYLKKCIVRQQVQK